MWGGRKKVDGRGGGDGDVIILFRNKMAIAERIEENENAKINEEPYSTVVLVLNSLPFTICTVSYLCSESSTIWECRLTNW